MERGNLWRGWTKLESIGTLPLAHVNQLNKTLQGRNTNKKYRNKVTYLLEINKRNYYLSQFLSCRNDSGKMWKLINSLTSSKSSQPLKKLFDPIKSNYSSNLEVMSNIFNTYFVSIGQQLASKIPPPVHHTYPVKVNGRKNSFVLHDTFVDQQLTTTCTI